MTSWSHIAAATLAIGIVSCGLGGEHVLGRLPGDESGLVGEGATGHDPPELPPQTGGDATTTEDTGDTGTEGDHDPDEINLAFITSEQFIGAEFGGLSGADARCQQAAGAAGLQGTYLAWLSDNETDARERFASARGWVRTDGAPVASRLDTYPTELYYPPDLDEYGERVVGEWVWSGTSREGKRQDPWGNEICGAWTDDGTVTYGLSGAVTWLWSTSEYGIACSTQARLHCFGVDQIADVHVSPQEGRLVFVSEGEFAADSGRDAADVLCQNEADAAALGGNFWALMALPDEAPIDRFDLEGPAWVRTDGLALFEHDQPMGETLAIGVGLNARGEPIHTSHRAWLGANSPFEPGTTATTCDAWTVLDPEGQAPLASALAADWLGWQDYFKDTAECTKSYRLLCFER